MTRVLVLNCGSSSVRYKLFDGDDVTAKGHVERIGEDGGEAADHLSALRDLLDRLDLSGLAAVGHRVVHGGERFTSATVITDKVVSAVEELVPLAPLHNPGALTGIRVARKLLPDVPQVAVFDTAFHQTLPEHAYTYAVPLEWRDEHRIRRYGFHGTSHAFVSGEAARLLGKPVEELDAIVLHLGNGASATAVRGGRSVDTSMGLTPLEGLVMGTRSGDLDPALHAHLHRQLGWSLEQIDQRLNRESGLKGLSGHNDFRELERLCAEGDEHAQLAFDVYCYRIRKYVGAYYAVLGHVDAVVFTAGVGQHAPDVRAASLAGLERLGIAVDPARNEAPLHGPAVVSPEGAEVAVLVIPTNEEWEIARQSLAVVRG